MNITVQDVNHVAQALMFGAMTWIGDNIFEVIGAIGIIANLTFVARSYYDKRRAAKEEERRAMERHEYEMELLKRKLNEVAE